VREATTAFVTSAMTASFLQKSVANQGKVKKPCGEASTLDNNNTTTTNNNNNNTTTTNNNNNVRQTKAQ